MEVHLLKFESICYLSWDCCNIGLDKAYLAFTDYLEYKEKEAKNIESKLKSDSQKIQKREITLRSHSSRGQERLLSCLLSWLNENG